jgi:hypothetical protein
MQEIVRCAMVVCDPYTLSVKRPQDRFIENYKCMISPETATIIGVKAEPSRKFG